MRVAHFVQRYPPALGGSEAYFARLSRFLAARGDQVSVFTSNALDLEAFWSPRGSCVPAGVQVEDGVEVRRYPLWRMPGRRWLLKPLSLVPHRLWQCLTLPCNPIAFRMWQDCGHAAQPFDVVHATAFPYAWPIACARRLARRLRVPFLLTPFLHLGNVADARDATRRAYLAAPFLFLLREADRIFVQTELERQALLAHGLPAAKIVLQGLGVDPTECAGGDRARVRAAWQVKEDDVVIGHLANQSVEKGTVDLLKAAQLLWQRGRPVVVALAGPEMTNFQRFRNAFVSAGRVLQLGVLDERQKRDFFAGIDLFALPSRSDSFGLVLLEAWANGVPNVAYRAGGVAEVIHDGSDGLLVPCGDIDSLADALGRLLDSPDERRRLGAAGQERTHRDFPWTEKLECAARVYDELTRR